MVPCIVLAGAVIDLTACLEGGRGGNIIVTAGGAAEVNGNIVYFCQPAHAVEGS